jgi:hypothetical protein
VIDTRTREVLASYTFTSATPTFVNDVVLAKDGGYFTDSQQPVFYRAAGAKAETIPLTGGSASATR